jgi:hypothetical protein
MDWLDKIKTGMSLIAAGCNENKELSDCHYCPFDEFCNAIQIGAEAGLNVDIPENWEE